MTTEGESKITVSSDSSMVKTSSSSDVASKSEITANVSSESAKQDITTLQNLKVHFLDVGQADSIFIELPNNETMLIDAGNSVDGNDIIKYIKDKGYSTVNYLIATHPHADHIGGMNTVVEGLDIKSVYMPRATHTTKTYEDLLTTIQTKGLKIKTAKAGVSIINANELAIDIVAPNNDKYEDLNDYSAVIKLKYKENSFLFTGDAESKSESQITANIDVDVLKVGHHGSNTSTSNNFLTKTSPKYAVVSVGIGNKYGHPASDTLDKLNKSGIQIFRTDEVGTIIFTSDGEKITIDKKASTIKENAPPKSASVSSERQTSNEKVDSAETKTLTVYVTKTGEKYHSSGCQYLRKSKIAMSLNDAKRSYSPCSRCNPPQ